MMRSLIALLPVAFCSTVLAAVESEQASDRRDVPVIDMHTHILNLSDIPVGGIVFAMLSDRTAAMVESALDRNMPGEEPASSMLTPNSAKSHQLDTPPEDPVLAAERKVVLTPEERDVFAEFLDLRQPNWQKDFSRQSAKESNTPPSEGSLQKLPTDLERLAQVLYHAEFMVESDEVAKSSASTFGNVVTLKSTNVIEATLWGYVRFIALLLHPRKSIANVLISEYRQGDLFVSHLMDMDRAYAGRSRAPFEQQQQLMRTITREFDGKLAHFTAFDPFRDSDAMETVNAGLAAGAIGVKFYPPSGYRAAQNEIPPQPNGPAGAIRRWKSRYENRSATDLNTTIRHFFAEMEWRQIPVFTHCTSHGFQAAGGYGWNSSPEYWAAVLDEFPNLRLCFGHAGGEQFWFSRPGAERHETPPEDTRDGQRAWCFGQQVVDLCLRHKNVYCEVAYLEDLLTRDGAKKFSERLARELPRVSTAGPDAGDPWQFGDKIMYGTDWHMLYKERGHQDYLSSCNKIISGIQAAKWQRKFFSGNAVAFLKLNELAVAAQFSDKQHAAWAAIVAGATPRPTK